MKKFLLAVLAVVAFVVGAMGSQQIKVPDSLPIGTAFPPVSTTFNLRIGSFDEWGILTDNYIHAMVPYTRDMGDMETAARRELKKLAERFVPLPGTEQDNYEISVNVWDFVPEMKDQRAIGNSYESSYFKLVRVNGRFSVPKEALDAVKIGYGDLGVYVGGLSEVIIALADELGNEYWSETSENGITDKTCSQYPGGVAYQGPDMLQVSIGVAYPTYYLEQYEDFTLPRGYYLLKFGADKAIWAKYDLETGRKLDSNEPKTIEPAPLGPVQSESVQLRISLVNLADVKLASFTKKNSASNAGLKLSVAGPVGKSVVLEYADTINGGWKELTTVSLVYGSAEHVDELVPSTSARFYRVR